MYESWFKIGSGRVSIQFQEDFGIPKKVVIF